MTNWRPVSVGKTLMVSGALAKFFKFGENAFYGDTGLLWGITYPIYTALCRIRAMSVYGLCAMGYGLWRNFHCTRTGLGWCISFAIMEWARTQTPTTRNCTVELPTFAVIAGVSPVLVQWKSLALEETPRWSDLLPRQVSMLFKTIRQKRLFQTSITLVASAGEPCSPRGRSDMRTSM